MILEMLSHALKYQQMFLNMIKYKNKQGNKSVHEHCIFNICLHKCGVVFVVNVAWAYTIYMLYSCARRYYRYYE